MKFRGGSGFSGRLGQIIVILSLVASVFWWAAHVETKVALLESHCAKLEQQILLNVERQKQTDQRQEEYLRRIESNVHEYYQRLDHRLDSMHEKYHSNSRDAV